METSAALSNAMVDVVALASLMVVTNSFETLNDVMMSSFAGEMGGDKALDAVLLSSTLAALWGWDIYMVIESDNPTASFSSMAAMHSMRTFDAILVSGCSVVSTFGESSGAMTLDAMLFVLPLSVSG